MIHLGIDDKRGGFRACKITWITGDAVTKDRSAVDCAACLAADVCWPGCDHSNCGKVVTPRGCKHAASCPYIDQDTCAWHACLALRAEANRTAAPEPSAIDHPAHYGGKDDPYEAIKVIRAWGVGFNIGSALKYIRRAGKKPGVDLLEDLEKALWYIKDEVEAEKARRAK